MTKPGYSIKATLEMISFYASSLCSWGDNVGILKHAIAFHSKIRHIVLDSIFYLHPQTSSCGIWLMIKYCFCLSLWLKQNSCHYPRSQVVEGLEEQVMVAGLIKKGKSLGLQEVRMCGSWTLWQILCAIVRQRRYIHGTWASAKLLDHAPGKSVLYRGLVD